MAVFQNPISQPPIHMENKLLDEGIYIHSREEYKLFLKIPFDFGSVEWLNFKKYKRYSGSLYYLEKHWSIRGYLLTVHRFIAIVPIYWILVSDALWFQSWVIHSPTAYSVNNGFMNHGDNELCVGSPLTRARTASMCLCSWAIEECALSYAKYVLVC